MLSSRLIGFENQVLHDHEFYDDSVDAGEMPDDSLEAMRSSMPCLSDPVDQSREALTQVQLVAVVAQYAEVLR